MPREYRRRPALLVHRRRREIFGEAMLHSAPPAGREMPRDISAAAPSVEKCRSSERAMRKLSARPAGAAKRRARCEAILMKSCAARLKKEPAGAAIRRLNTLPLLPAPCGEWHACNVMRLSSSIATRRRHRPGSPSPWSAYFLLLPRRSSLTAVAAGLSCGVMARVHVNRPWQYESQGRGIEEAARLREYYS